MIQRIQTIYLSGVVILCALMFVFPFGEIQSSRNIYVLDSFQELILTIFVTAVFIVALVSVFMFRKRPTQIILCKLNILLLAGLIFTVSHYLDTGSSIPAEPADVAEINYRAGIAFPMVSIVLTFLASRAIKKDDDLVRSADRVR